MVHFRLRQVVNLACRRGLAMLAIGPGPSRPQGLSEADRLARMKAMRSVESHSRATAQTGIRVLPCVLKGPGMSYYGRWTYKYAIASEKGAAAAILIHETGPAGYPFSVVTGSWGRENFEIRQGGENEGRVKVEGWVSL